MSNIVDIRTAEHNDKPKKARISVSLRNLSRQCRKEIIGSFAFQNFWFGKISPGQYLNLLQIHYFLRKTLEDHLRDIGPVFSVVNQFDNTEKRFVVDRFVTPDRLKAGTLQSDIIELVGTDELTVNLPDKALELAQYIKRAREVYSISLLGILYMLEETVTYAGPRIANSLEKHMALNGRAQSYLRGQTNRKADLWAFRKSLDQITDFQTSANIVIASTLTYRMYQDLLDPKQLRRLPQSKLMH